MNSNDILELGKFLVTSIGVMAAIFAYGKWRQELVGKDKYDVGRRLGLKAIELANSLKIFRNGSVIRAIEEKLWPPRTNGEQSTSVSDLYFRQNTSLNYCLSLCDDLEKVCWEAEMLGVDVDAELHSFYLVIDDIWEAASHLEFHSDKYSDSEKQTFLALVRGRSTDATGRKIEMLQESVLQKATILMHGKQHK